ncbi:MAG: DUF2911 domain-containing protein [Chitinophagaceae bacterium]
MSLPRHATNTLLVSLIFLIYGCADDQPVREWSDEGVLVYRLGTDTIGYQYFRMQGDSVNIRSVYLPGGFTLTETSGELQDDGAIKNLQSIQQVNDSLGHPVLSRQLRIGTTAGVTSVDITGAVAGEYMLPNNLYAVSSGGPVTDYLIPFWPRYSSLKDSTLGLQQAFGTSRRFWILKITDNLVYAGSDLLGKIKMRVDSLNRLVSVDATGSPLHIRAEVIRGINFDSLLTELRSRSDIQNMPELSPVSKNIYHFADLDIVLNYSRPSKRGRKIFGSVVSYEQTWRLGANRSTEITFSNPVYFNNRRLERGRYSLFAVIAPDAGMLLINDHPGIWGTDHESEWDGLRIPFELEKLAEPREQMELTIFPAGHGRYCLRMEWDDLRASAYFSTTAPDTD